jgi:predicted transport protein
LTAYNSEYSHRSFQEKKEIPGGFADSAVRLNKLVREQPAWTEEQMRARTILLAERALRVWGGLSVEQKLIDRASYADLRELASKRDVASIPMSSEARSLVEKLRGHILSMGENILELAEGNSISYHAPQFFLEILPRRYRLTLLLGLEFNEIDEPTGLAQDATQWKFLVHARNEGGVTFRVTDDSTLDAALPLIRQAYAGASE